MATANASRVAIVGGGPAGMSCALWLKNYGLRPLVVERAARLGGMQRASPYPNLWLLGSPGRTARQNAEDFERHVEAENIETLHETAPVSAQAISSGGFALGLESADGGKQSIETAALIIATGTSFQGGDWLGRVDGARALIQSRRILPNPAAAGEPGLELGSRVLIVGGGDNAFDVAYQIARPGRHVTIAMRAGAPRAQPALVTRATGGAQIKANATVTGVADGVQGIAVRFSDGSSLTADRIVLCLGYAPNTRETWIESLGLTIDPDGYIAVDTCMETSRPGVFAIGDVSNPQNPCTVTALAAGAIAARVIHDRLVGRQP